MEKTILAFVALGSNVGDRLSYLNQAVVELSQLNCVLELESSGVYETEPVTEIPQDWFLNAVCRLKVHTSVEVFFQKLCDIEERLGKIPKPKNFPRAIDLDLIFFGDLHLSTKLLTVPHPLWMQRAFVLYPLQEVIREHPMAAHCQQLLETVKHQKIIRTTHLLPFARSVTCVQ